MPDRVKVHIGLTRDAQERLQKGGEPAVAKWAADMGVDAVQSARLARYGILTGEADAARVPDIESQPGIDFVEKDEKKRAL